MTNIILAVLLPIVVFILLTILKQKKVFENGVLPRILIGLIVFVIVFIPGCIKKVEANNIGIEFDVFNGGIQKETLKPGYYFMAPWVQIYNIDTKVQKVNYDKMFVITGKDQGYVTVALELQFQVSPENAERVFSTYGKIPTADNMKSFVEQVVNEAAADNVMEEVLGTQINQYKLRASDLLREDLAPLGIELVILNFADIDGGPQYEAKIQALLAAEQEKILKAKQQEAILIEEQTKIKQKEAEEERKNIELEAANLRLIAQAEANKQQKQIQAEADALVVKTQAEAEAERIRLEAEAQAAATLARLTAEADGLLAKLQAEAEGLQSKLEAEAAGNKLLAESLNAQLLEMYKYDAWKNGGQVPQIIIGQDGTGTLTFLDLAALLEGQQPTTPTTPTEPTQTPVTQ